MDISVKLDKDFERYFNVLKEEFGEEFLDINGLSDSKLSYSDFLDNFVAKKTVADASVDGSSNVSSKDIVTLRSEMSKPHEKVLALNKIFQKMKKKYGLRTAKKWLELEWNRALYMHDCNSATLLSYCFAYDITRLAEEGLFYLPDHEKKEPAKHLETFVDFVKEFINFNSNRTSGACGLPNLIPYLYYFWSNDVRDGHYPRNQTPEVFAKSEIQRLIYGFNQPYTRDGIQSAFINTSIFDSEYFDALFGGSVFPNGEFMIDHKDGIMQFQKWFLEEMSAIKDRGRMFTFPVNTISLIKKDGKFADEEFARWASNHNRKWNDSNIFVDDSVTSLSNCCFDGLQEATVRTIGTGIGYTGTFRYLYHALQGETIEVPFRGKWKEATIIRLPKRKMYCVTTVNGVSLIMTDNHISCTLYGDKTTDTLTCDDYLLFDPEVYHLTDEDDKSGEYLQREDGSLYFRIASVEPCESSDEYCYCFRIKNQYAPYFTLPNGVITHNCRLKSDIKDLGYFNSVGGSGLKVGSIKVSTINLARIAYESGRDEQKYIKILADRLLIDMQALDVVRDIIKRNVEKGLLPNFQEGLMDFKHLYNTVGINGIFETMKYFGYTHKDEFGDTFYDDTAMEFGKKIFDVIHKATKEFSSDKDYTVNVEQVPGETCAARFQQADVILYKDSVVDDLPLYGNQWIPLGIKTTLKERIRICAAFDGYCNGGSICHINVDKPIDNEETAWKLLDYITNSGVTYFAFNGKLSSCENEHLFYGNVCPECGKPKNAEYTRTVGFYTKIDSWSKERKEEYKMREWQPLNDKGVDA